MLSVYLSILETQEDKNSFEGLYLKYGNDILRFVMSKLRHQHNAEDVAHDTWLYVADHFEKLRCLDEDCLKSYLFKIAYHKCMDLFRRQKAEIDFSEEQSDDAVIADENEILLACCKREEVETIVSCIEQLDESYRDVLNLYYLYEHNTTEIAEILHLRDGTVRQRLSRGRRKLIALLEKKGL